MPKFKSTAFSGRGVPSHCIGVKSIRYYPKIRKKGGTPRLCLIENGGAPLKISPSAAVRIFREYFGHFVPK